MQILDNISLEKLSILEKKEYYKKIREECLMKKDNQVQIGQNIIKSIYPFLRKYKVEIQGDENIPKDSNVLFVVNHSNSHDIFNAYEVLSLLDRKGSVMVATDCLNPITVEIFNVSNATLLDRRNREDRYNSIVSLSKKILSGKDGVIFGEGTWNLHPILPMHNIKCGSSKISAITQVPIIPTIFEYVENDGLFIKDSELFKKCVIRFGKPIVFNYNESLIDNTNKVKDSMVVTRKQIWNDFNINKKSINEIDPEIYINHTYAKKFKALGFTYDSKKEQEFLLFLGNEKKENEYTIDDNGILKPGITEKNKKLRKILYK